MNPFNLDTPKANYFGKGLIEEFLSKKRSKPSSYSRMKENQIKKRRAKNKMAYKSKRKNIILAKNLHVKLA